MKQQELKKVQVLMELYIASWDMHVYAQLKPLPYRELATEHQNARKALEGFDDENKAGHILNELENCMPNVITTVRSSVLIQANEAEAIISDMAGIDEISKLEAEFAVHGKKRVYAKAKDEMTKALVLKMEEWQNEDAIRYGEIEENVAYVLNVFKKLMEIFEPLVDPKELKKKRKEFAKDKREAVERVKFFFEYHGPIEE